MTELDTFQKAMYLLTNYRESFTDFQLSYLLMVAERTIWRDRETAEKQREQEAYVAELYDGTVPPWEPEHPAQG